MFATHAQLLKLARISGFRFRLFQSLRSLPRKDRGLWFEIECGQSEYPENKVVSDSAYCDIQLRPIGQRSHFCVEQKNNLLTSRNASLAGFILETGNLF